MMSSNLQLSSLFAHPSTYEAEGGYKLLPFKLIRLDSKRYVLTNLSGEYLIVTATELKELASLSLTKMSPVYDDLIARHFIYEGDASLSLELVAAKYRTKQHRLAEFTSLHIFVTTLRCDHSCQYCQVSRVSEDRRTFDMTKETASKAIDLMFKSPARYLKVEFQGGESLLNFDIIRFIVLEARRRNVDRELDFVIASNLSFLSDDVLNFAREHEITFSCSLDGPEAVHNKNRPRVENDSYQRTIAGVRTIREKLGYEAVSALMTTTAASLSEPERIIDEYVCQNFRSIFLRWISPFGFAVKTGSRIGYDTERFLEFYKRGLDYIFKLNLQGTPLQETYASIILQKILTPFPTGYLDLQSPTGLGGGVLVYNYDGNVYASDESRMLAEMDDTSFCLGNVHTHSYEQLFLESPAIDLLLDTMVEGIPGCEDCAFSPYCGTDPVFNYATQGDIVGHRPTSAFCRRNMEIIRHLISILEARDERSKILRGWV